LANYQFAFVGTVSGHIFSKFHLEKFLWDFATLMPLQRLQLKQKGLKPIREVRIFWRFFEVLKGTE
jgi:hypothetical protein